MVIEPGLRAEVGSNIGVNWRCPPWLSKGENFWISRGYSAVLRPIILSQFKTNSWNNNWKFSKWLFLAKSEGAMASTVHWFFAISANLTIICPRLVSFSTIFPNCSFVVWCLSLIDIANEFWVNKQLSSRTIRYFKEDF